MMFRNSLESFLKYKLWLAVLLAFNLLFGILLWLQDSGGFLRLFPAMLLGSVGIYMITAWIAARADRRKIRALQNMLEEPELWMEPEDCFEGAEREAISDIARALRQKNEKILQQERDVREFEEYMETWVHEIKTPLSLMTFVLDNRQDEMSPAVHYRMEYVRTRMQEDVERMLYYGRIHSARRDYLLASVYLDEICREVMDEYAVLLEEQQIWINNEVGKIQVITDRRGLMFCIRQVVSNAVKYARQDGEQRWIRLSAGKSEEDKKVILSIRDNGTGVKSYDLPFIFEKGFTGDKGMVNKTATGMELYLTAQVAEQLNIGIETPLQQEGFEIRLIFTL